MGCVYKLTSPSGKVYVGITRGSAENRFKVHAKEAASGKSALAAAIRKYGASSFTLEVLERYENWEDLCEAEKKNIEDFGSLAPGGYNLTTGGDGCPGLPADVEAARVAKSALSRTGLKLSEAHRKSLSDSHKGIPSSRKGKSASESSKSLMSAAAKARWQRPEQREKLLEHLRKLNNG